MGHGGAKECVQALRDVVVAIMIETPATVDNLAEVLAGEGVDMVQGGGSSWAAASRPSPLSGISCLRDGSGVEWPQSAWWIAAP